MIGGDFVENWYAFVRFLHVRRKFEKKRLHLLRGSLCILHICRGSSFGLPKFCALWCALCELCFVSAVLSRCPCLREPRLGLASDRVFRLFFGFGSLAWRFVFVVVFFSFSL